MAGLGWYEFLTTEALTAGTLQGYIMDQAALYGLISRARDLGLTLLSVKRLNEAENIGPQALEGDVIDDIENSQSVSI